MLTQLASLRQTVSCTYVLNPRRENAGIPSSCAPCAESVSRSSLRLCQAFGTVQTVFLQPLTFLKSNDTNAWFCPAADAGCRLGFGCGSPDRTPSILEHKRRRGCACGLRRGGLSQVGQGDDGVSGVHGGVDGRGVSVCQQSAPQGVLEGFPEVRPTQFGGYCSCAVAHGYTAPVDAKDAWEVYRGKLYLNFSANIHKQWIEQQDYNIQRGVENWPQLAGERGWVIASKVQQLAKPLVENETVDRVRRWFESKIFKD